MHELMYSHNYEIMYFIAKPGIRPPTPKFLHDKCACVRVLVQEQGGIKARTSTLASFMSDLSFATGQPKRLESRP